ncbi:MAG: NB-ARC domain-containing protein [Chloroflexota bacterium]
MSALFQEPLTAKSLYDDLLEALRLRHDPGTQNPLGYLRIVRQALRTKSGSIRHILNAILDEALDSLAKLQPEQAMLLRLRFLDGETAQAVSNRLGLSSAAFSRLQEKAVLGLADILLQREEQVKRDLQIEYESRLESRTYSRLFGIEELRRALLEKVAPGQPPWLVTLEGMGGIGKTTLADATMRQAIEHDLFDDFGWISARQFRLLPLGYIQSVDQPALTVEQLVEQLCLQLLGEQALPKPFSVERALPILLDYVKEVPCLVVVDNLETIADINELLPTLQRLTNPSKFILTSREKIHSETLTFPFRIPSLSEEATLALIRHEANERNQIDLAEAGDDNLRPIFEIVGGNPLAVRLVIGQTDQSELATVLADLKDAVSEAADNLYTFIYRYAWSNLDEISQQILLAMPLIPETGETASYIEGIMADMPPEKVRDGLGKLVSLYLVNKQGNFTNRFYSIHNLTRTFLLKQVAKWQP